MPLIPVHRAGHSGLFRKTVTSGVWSYNTKGSALMSSYDILIISRIAGLFTDEFRFKYAMNRDYCNLLIQLVLCELGETLLGLKTTKHIGKYSENGLGYNL
jgi:hypothetical protein